MCKSFVLTCTLHMVDLCDIGQAPVHPITKFKSIWLLHTFLRCILLSYTVDWKENKDLMMFISNVFIH